MKKDKTLLIMAAGMGSRYGGLKQVEKFGPNGEFLIDYSIYDAIKEGFTKVVFVIKEENEELFKKTVGNRVAESIEVEYAFQDMNTLPEGYVVPEGRVKPWGTAHAILSAKDLIHEPFVIINADDFYGRDAFKVAANFLEENEEENCYAVVGYQVKNTLSENGAVKRGVCLEENHELVELIESVVEEKDGVIEAIPLDTTKPAMVVKADGLVSMNMLCFQPGIMNYIEDHFAEFLDKNLSVDPMKCEYLIPDVLEMARNNGDAKVILESTNASWFGVTYPEDKDIVASAIQTMVDNEIYPENLWEKANIKIK